MTDWLMIADVPRWFALFLGLAFVAALLAVALLRKWFWEMAAVLDDTFAKLKKPE